MSLQKSLPRIAAKILRNTRCAPPNLKFKFELISSAYTAHAVERDFEDWCREHTEDKFPYPITEYLKVIDSRLGYAVEERRADTKDPKAVELGSITYRLTGILPSISAVATLLLTHTFEEIKDALTEYADTISDRDAKSAVRAFFSDGGAGAVILARRERAKL